MSVIFLLVRVPTQVGFDDGPPNTKVFGDVPTGCLHDELKFLHHMAITRPFVDDIIVKKHVSDQPIDFFVGPSTISFSSFEYVMDER